MLLISHKNEVTRLANLTDDMWCSYISVLVILQEIEELNKNIESKAVIKTEQFFFHAREKSVSQDVARVSAYKQTARKKEKKKLKAVIRVWSVHPAYRFSIPEIKKMYQIKILEVITIKSYFSIFVFFSFIWSKIRVFIMRHFLSFFSYSITQAI